MRQSRWIFLLASVSVFLICGCGGSGSHATDSTATADGSAQFRATKATRDIVEFGEEAPVDEREAASAVLKKSLVARQAADFASQCATLNSRMVEELSNGERGSPLSACPRALRRLAEPLSGSEKVRRDTLKGPIAALRVNGSKGYALYHGTDGRDHAMEMEKQDGQWKVAAILTTELSSSAGKS